MTAQELISKYFPQLSAEQQRQIELMGEVYPQWNEKINVISRRDIDNLYINHVLHSLVIARFWGDLHPGTEVLDLGTGGGFPGIPLAVVYPDVQFHLIDRIGKKLLVASEVIKALGLKNVTVQHGDVGECHRRFDYVVSRAVMPLDKLVKVSARNVARGRRGANRYDNGIVCLKGGDLTDEMAAVTYPVIEYTVNEFVCEPAFDTKKLVYVPIVANK